MPVGYPKELLGLIQARCAKLFNRACDFPFCNCIVIPNEEKDHFDETRRLELAEYGGEGD